MNLMLRVCAAFTFRKRESSITKLSQLVWRIPEEYADADPMHLMPGDVPVVVVQGADDTLVPVDANRAVADVLADAVGVSYVELEDVEHFALVDPLTEAWKSTVLPALSGS